MEHSDSNAIPKRHYSTRSIKIDILMIGAESKLYFRFVDLNCPSFYYSAFENVYSGEPEGGFSTALA